MLFLQLSFTFLFNTHKPPKKQETISWSDPMGRTKQTAARNTKYRFPHSTNLGKSHFHSVFRSVSPTWSFTSCTSPRRLFSPTHDHYQRSLWDFFSGFLVSENQIVTGWSKNKGWQHNITVYPGGRIVIVTVLWWKQRSRNVINHFYPRGVLCNNPGGRVEVTLQVTTWNPFYKDHITLVQGFLKDPWRKIIPVNVPNPSFEPW